MSKLTTIILLMLSIAVLNEPNISLTGGLIIASAIVMFLKEIKLIKL